MAVVQLRSRDIPELPVRAVQTALRETNKVSSILRKQIGTVYRPLFKDYREEVVGHFYANYPQTVKEGEQPVWFPSAARKLKSYDILSQSFTEMMAEAEGVVGEILSTDLTESFDAGFDRSLWALHQSGVDVEEASESLGGIDEKSLLLIAAGVGGLSYLARLKEATKVARGRFTKWLRATIFGGRSIQDTLQGYDAVTKSHQNRVTKLAENESHRSMLIGVDLAQERVAKQTIGAVWLTQSKQPCQICLEKNLTITQDQPIEGSHPGCRCIKVPIALDYKGQPVDYVNFLQSIGRR